MTKNSKIDKYIGELSYPVYISHIFVIYCMDVLQMPMEGGRGINVIIITLIFSIILNEFIAKPIEIIRIKRVLKI